LRRRIYDFDVSYEAIAHAPHGLYKRGRTGGITQGLADFADGCVNAHFDINEQLGTPKPVHDVGTSYQLQATLYQQDEQIHRSTFQSHWPPASAQFVGAYIELEVAKTKP
jgi:hypothetical protein